MLNAVLRLPFTQNRELFPDLRSSAAKSFCFLLTTGGWQLLYSGIKSLIFWKPQAIIWVRRAFRVSASERRDSARAQQRSVAEPLERRSAFKNAG